jgi:hypothetical protein
VWYCASCGYEVGRGGRCHNCKQPLVESPLAELADGEAEDEVGYRLDDWDDAERADLIEALIDHQVRHRFEADELVIAAGDEAEVDELVAEVTAAASAAARDDDGDTGDGAEWPEDDEDEQVEPDATTLEIVGALLDAARRLRADPTDMVADGDLAEAGARVFALDRVRGIDHERWAAVGRVTRRLLGALGADVALEEEISSEAAVLCRLLEPVPVMAAGDGPAVADGAVRLTPGPTGVTTTAPGSTGASPAAPGSTGATPAGVGEGEEEQEAVDRHQVVYDLSDWLPEERARLDLLLDRDGIVHGWEGKEVVVSELDWDRVDQLCTEVDPSGSAAIEDDDDDGEERYQALSELFGAADRLAGDPEDKAKRNALLDAAEVVTSGPVPFGMSDDQWWQIRGRVRTLVDAIGEEQPPEAVRLGSASLAELLRGFV